MGFWGSGRSEAQSGGLEEEAGRSGGFEEEAGRSEAQSGGSREKEAGINP